MDQETGLPFSFAKRHGVVVTAVAEDRATVTHRPGINRRILAELQRDSRLTTQELAERVGMSTSATWRRVRGLEEAGVIERYAAIVNAKKSGFGLASMVHVSLARHEQKNVDHFVQEVRKHPEVLECFATSGEADFHLRVVVEDIDAYNVFLDDFIMLFGAHAVIFLNHFKDFLGFNLQVLAFVLGVGDRQRCCYSQCGDQEGADAEP